MENLHYETIIVGGGPAGATCGHILQKNSKECLIIDRYEFPREKICGGGLTPKTQVLLDKIFEGLNYNYSEFDSINLYNQNELLCSFAFDAPLKIVVRKEFDAILINEYLRIGGAKITGTVSKIKEQDEKVYVSLRSGETFTCNYLIGADGANSVVRKYLHPNTERGMILYEKTEFCTASKDVNVYFEGKHKGFMYLFPNPKGYVVGMGGDTVTLPVFHEMLDSYNFHTKEKTKGAYLPMFDKQDYPFRKNIMLIGDAGGYVDSMTGEGIYLAIKSGENAALSIINNIDLKELNQSILKYTNRRIKMARIFFWKPIHKLFLKMFSIEVFHSWFNKKINRAFSHPY